ncbi:glycoside hydrolase family 16 protein [Pendulispora rubella]|uniref:Glycoside hydrolase family 16 protein n=1 Tax=Pendulispora rubella TaxID=2741070 RepID=A0ABZ2L8A9_9BACT
MVKNHRFDRGVKAMLMAVLLAAMAIAVLPIRDAAAATYGYNIVSSNSVQFYVNDAPWADVHYQINTDGQQNFRMSVNGGNNTYTVNNVPTGATVRYFFTIGNGSGGATDTAWTQFTMGTTTPPPAGNWQVVWEDQFDGSGQPNASNWNYHVGNGLNPGANAFDGWGNGEWEWYRPENAYLQGGNLVIRADYNDTPTNIAGRNWYQRSARITTQGKRSWQYGRIEARIQMPNAVGSWPAFWMMGTSNDATYTSNYGAPIGYYDRMGGNWSSCGEIDIMEHKNSDASTVHNLFWDSRVGVYPWADGQNNNQPTTYGTGNVAQFHLYSIEWDANEIRWYVDRETNPNPVHVINVSAANREEFRKPFFIILNLALGGQFPGAEPNKADFPLYMRVDYVRVWQKT